MNAQRSIQCRGCGAIGRVPVPGKKSLQRWTILGTTPWAAVVLLPFAFASAVDEGFWALPLAVVFLLEHLAWVAFVAGRAAPRGAKAVRIHVAIVLGGGFLARAGVALGAGVLTATAQA